MSQISVQQLTLACIVTLTRSLRWVRRTAQQRRGILLGFIVVLSVAFSMKMLHAIGSGGSHLFSPRVRAPMIIDTLLRSDRSQRMFCNELRDEEIQAINETYGLLSVPFSSGTGNLLFQVAHMIDCGDRVHMPSYVSKTLTTEGARWIGGCFFLPLDVARMRELSIGGPPRERGDLPDAVVDPSTTWFGARDCQVEVDGVLTFPQEEMDAEAYHAKFERVGLSERLREAVRVRVRDVLLARPSSTAADDDDDDDAMGDGEKARRKAEQMEAQPLGDWFRCKSLVANDELIVHVRSGDQFAGHAHPPYFQPPLSWYELVIRQHRKVFGPSAPVTVLTTDSALNPVIEALERTHGEQSGRHQVAADRHGHAVARKLFSVRREASITIDACALLGARSVALASSTFSGSLVSLVSDTVEHVYLPLLYHNSYTKRFVREHDFLPWFLYGWRPRLHQPPLSVSRYCFPKYACDGWLDRPDQRRKMIEWNGTIVPIQEGEELSEKCDPDDPERVDYTRVRHDEKSLRQMRCLFEGNK